MATTLMPSMAKSDTIAELKTPETISAKSLFTEVNASGLAEINDSNSSLYKVGRAVFGQIRFSLKTNTNASTTLFTPKTQALKAKWYPTSTPANYAVFPAFSTWDASKTALVFMNDSYEFGIGVATAGDYVVTLSYVARS